MPQNDAAGPDAVEKDGAGAREDQKDTDTSTEIEKPDLEDPDIAELVAAKEAADKDGGAKASPEGEGKIAEPPPKQEAEPAKGEQKPEEPEPGKGDGKPRSDDRIPRPRFNEVLHERDQFQQAAAYWRGVAEANAIRGQVPKDGADPQPPVKTPEERRADIRTKRKALAKKYDDGEINAVDLDDARQKLEDEEFAIRQEMLEARFAPKGQPKADQQPGPVSDDLYIETLTAKLEEEHPYVTVLSGDEFAEEWAFLTRKAATQLIAEGVSLPKGELPLRERYMLRKRIAELSDQYGPRFAGDAKPAKSSDAAQKGAGGLSQTAQARLDKINLAHSAPPDVNQMGSAGKAGIDYSEADILKMTDEEITALPASVRSKFTGLSP